MARTSDVTPCGFSRDMRGSDDVRVIELAERQHGLAARWQLTEIGLDRWWVRRAVASGGWELATRRVLRRAGGSATAEQALLIGVLDAGSGALASYRSSGWLWGLPRLDFHPNDVLRPNRPSQRQVDGSIHLPRLWLPGEATSVRGIPCVSLPLTLFQLAGVLPRGRTESLVDHVAARSPAVLARLHDLLPVVARRGRPGIAVMRELLADRPVGARVPESGNERRFESLLRRAGERSLERQVDVGGHSYVGRTDYRDAELPLLVEVQSGLHHSSLSDRRRDEARVAELLAAGYLEVLQIWDDMLWDRPWEVAPAVRAARERVRARSGHGNVAPGATISWPEARAG